MKLLLYVATVLILVNYLFWQQIENYLGFQVFEINTAIFIFAVCAYMFFTDKDSFIKYILFAISLNNMFDELTLKTDNLNISEILVGISILVFSLIKQKKCLTNILTQLKNYLLFSLKSLFQRSSQSQ